MPGYWILSKDTGQSTLLAEVAVAHSHLLELGVLESSAVFLLLVLLELFLDALAADLLADWSGVPTVSTNSRKS